MMAHGRTVSMVQTYCDSFAERVWQFLWVDQSGWRIAADNAVVSVWDVSSVLGKSVGECQSALEKLQELQLAFLESEGWWRRVEY